MQSLLYVRLTDLELIFFFIAVLIVVFVVLL